MVEVALYSMLSIASTLSDCPYTFGCQLACSIIYTLCLKKRPTFTTCYNFYIHSSIAKIFGTNVAEKVGNQNILYTAAYSLEKLRRLTAAASGSNIMWTC